MKATSAVVVMVALLSGCGSCQRSEEPTAAGEAAGTSSKEAAAVQPTSAGKIQVAPLQATPLSRAGASAPQAPAAGNVPPAPEMAPDAAADTEQADEGDCIVVADANPDYGPPPLNVAFSAEAECGTGQLTYKWNFGDGSPPNTEANPTHAYTKAGDFTASVVVSGGPGTSASDEIDITVEEGEAPPE